MIQLEKGGEAFTGGSNLAVSPSLPEWPLQRCPLKISDSQMFHNTCKAGLSNKLAAVDSKHTETNIVDWFADLASQMMELGLDTVFRIPNASWTEEVHILHKWGEIKAAKVNAWRDELKQGVNDP